MSSGVLSTFLFLYFQFNETRMDMNNAMHTKNI